MPQNPIAVHDFRPGGLSGALAVSFSNSSAGVSAVKASPGAAMAVHCLSSGAISFYDATFGSSITTAQSASSSVYSSNIGASNQFFANSSMTAGQTGNLEWPCSNGVAVSLGASGVFAIRFQ